MSASQRKAGGMFSRGVKSPDNIRKVTMENHPKKSACCWLDEKVEISRA